MTFKTVEFESIIPINDIAYRYGEKIINHLYSHVHGGAFPDADGTIETVQNWDVVSAEIDSDHLVLKVEADVELEPPAQQINITGIVTPYGVIGEVD